MDKSCGRAASNASQGAVRKTSRSSQQPSAMGGRRPPTKVEDRKSSSAPQNGRPRERPPIYEDTDWTAPRIYRTASNISLCRCMKDEELKRRSLCLPLRAPEYCIFTEVEVMKRRSVWVPLCARPVKEEEDCMVTRKEKRSNCSSMSIQSQGQEARNYAHKLAEALYEIQRYINVYSTHRPAMQKCLDQLRNTEIILMEFHQHFAIASNMAATERSSKGKNSFAELAWVLISQGATGTLMKSIEMVIPGVSAARQRSVPLDRRQLETVVGAFLQELMDVTYALQYLRRKMEHLKKCHYSTPKGQARGQDDSRASLVIPLTGRVAGALESSRKAEEKLNRFPSRLARYFTSSDKIKENSMMNLVILVSDVAGEMKSVQDELCGIHYNLESCNVYIGGLSL